MAVRGWVFGERCCAEVGQECREGGLGFYAGEGGAVAEVDAAAEAEVLVVLAGGVEPVGVLEAPGVAAARGHGEYHRHALGEGCARDVYVGEGYAL